MDALNKKETAIPGRGASFNPGNRFEKVAYEPDLELEENQTQKPKTQLFRDVSQTFIVFNDSPDVGFSAGINPYRGCEHGCIYCYARPSHEYLGFSSGVDFESKLMVKLDAPKLLRKELAAKKWKPQVIALSGNTDCYQPIERKLKITRRCLEVLLDFRNPVCLITKNKLIQRDVDLLQQLAQFQAVKVFITITSLDGNLTRLLEPRTSQPASRLETIRVLSEAGIPTGVLTAPVIPGLTDHEIPSILKEAAAAGAQSAGYTMLRLPYSVAPLFEKWLEDHFPMRKEKVLNNLRSLRGGKLYQADFSTRMRGEGLLADQIEMLFHLSCKKAALNQRHTPLTTTHFRNPEERQMELFDTKKLG